MLYIFNTVISFLNLKYICLFMAIIIILLWILKLGIIKRKSFLDIFILIVLVILGLCFIKEETRLIWKIVIIVLLGLNVIYSLVDFILSFKVYLTRKAKVQDYLKNSEFEYYLQLNRKNKVIDFSSNILTLTNRSKDGIYHLRFPEFLFDCLNIETVNNEKYTLETLPEFRRAYNETVSKLKNYTFTFSAKDENNKLINYEGLIQPIYLSNKMIGKNIYISVNRMEILEKTRKALAECTTDLEDVKKQLYVLMSLTSGVVMYFDFQTKTYITTEAFRKFTETEQEEYDFDDFLRMLHAEDVQTYIDQSATVNSLESTRLKFRMIIGGRDYNMIEDSIYLAKEEKLVSVVRVASDERRDETPEVVLSTKEATDILADLENSNIDKMADSTLDMLNKLKKN